MTRNQKLAVAVSAAMSMGAMAQIASAATAYSDNLNAATGSGTNTITSNGYTYTVTATAGDGGAFTDGSKTNTTANTLSLTNDATANANANGIVYATTPTSAYTGFNQQLSANTNSVLTWTFNLQQIRTAPSGMAASNYGAAYILGSTTSDFANTGEGYAVLIGNTGSSDSIRLFRFTSGLNAIGLNSNTAGTYGAPLLASPTTNGAPPTGTVTDYYSIKVTLDTSTNTWGMVARDDGTTSFSDPNAGTYGIPSTVVDSTFVNSVLTHSGAYWAYANGANQTSKFDNLTLDVSPIGPPPPPRNLTWDADATGTATDGSGTWGTANSWIDAADASHVTYDSARPDNATFGAGSGAGTASIDVGTGQNVGMLTFAANSPVYTLNNGAISVAGYDDDNNPTTALEGIIAQQSATINSGLNWVNTAHIHVNGSTSTLTVNGAMGGAGHIDKFGTGTLTLNTPAPLRTGTMDMETGTVRVTSANGLFTGFAGSISGLGTGQTNVHSGATLWMDASGGDFRVGSTGGQLFMGDGSTLRVTGNFTWGKNFPQFVTSTDSTAPKNSTIHVDAGGFLLFNAQIRNSSATLPVGGGSFHTIHIDGPGTVKLTNAGSDGGGDSNIFGGSWDLSNGTMILGQNTETNGSAGDTLNNLGYKDGDAARGNTITIGGTGKLVATENTPNPIGPVSWYRANIVLNGGTLASGNGKDASFGGHFTTSAASTSTVATYDPLNPTVARNVSLVHGAPDTGFGLWNTGDTSWNGNLVVDPGTTTGGKFVINRDGGTVTVTPGATITVNQGSTLELDGTKDALSDGTNHVNVVNNSTSSLNVLSNTKNIGTLTGTGNSNISGGAILNVKHIRQNALNIADGGRVNVRTRAQTGGNQVNVLGTLNLNTTGLLDTTDNDLVINNMPFTTVKGLVLAGFGNPGGGGIYSSTSDGSQILALFDNSLLGASDWQGVPIGPNATVGKYTYFGDVNFDGQVTGDDYTIVDSNLNTTPPVGFEWLSGDANLDGVVTGDDYTTIDSNLGLGAGNPLSSSSIGGGLTPSSLSAVPEPGSIGVLAAAGAGLLLRRRRSR